MTFPALTLAFILATLYGAVFHLFAGGDARRLAMYLLAAWVGFAVGQLLGMVLNLQILTIGTLQLASATAGSFAALFSVMLLMRRRRLFA